MSGCDWGKKSFQVGMGQNSPIAYCEDCKAKILDFIRRINGRTLCKECSGKIPGKGISGGIPNVNTDSWIPGVYEHIASEPIYIESKKQLIEECEKRGLMPKALMKPKSQEKGWEIRR